MATIKDALDIIGKLTTKDRERLRTMLLSTVTVKSTDMKSFLTDERFSNGKICPFVVVLTLFATVIEKMKLKSICVEIVVSPL